LKILFITGNYLPGKNGGIENYTHWLAKVLIQNNIQVEVAALNVNRADDYVYEGIKVNDLKGSFNNFQKLVQTNHFDICHFQEYSAFGGIEMQWFLKAKEYSKVYFTFHLPYFTCYKNDFRYKAVEDCNTFNDPDRCSSCVIADKSGYGRYHSQTLLNILLTISDVTGMRQKLKGKITSQYKKLNELIAVCDYIFIYADWFKMILAENGYNQPTIKKIPYKTKTVFPKTTDPAKKEIKNKILFVGRIEYQKGLHLLCKAMNEIDTSNIQLDVYGNIVHQDYFDECYKKYAFNFKATMNYPTLMQMLSEYDFLVMPSVFTEMYSMMIKDAFYAQLPVIASAAKGNRDAVIDGVNGLLFNYNDARDLAVTIDKGYALIRNGWHPAFEYSTHPEKDIAEITSYYFNKTVIQK
jgi:glycosyltransferase involved in cell wall biosynthesis